MSFTPLLGVGTLVFTFVNFLTYLRSKNTNGMVTQLIAWLAGIAGIFIAAHTQFASDIKFGTQVLSKMGWQSQLFLGLIATSILSTVNEVKKAIDNNDTAAKAPLIERSGSAAGAVVSAAQGGVSLDQGAVTVAHQAVKADSQILVTALGTQQGNLRVSARAPGSFTISSTEPADAGPVAYKILNP